MSNPVNETPQFPHLPIYLTLGEDVFLSRLWQALQSSGHLMSLEQTRAVMHLVNRSFAPPLPQPQTV